MKKTFLKILFPFFIEDRHDFLMQNWWFRLMIIIYLILFTLTPFIIFSIFMDANTGWCFDALFLASNDYNSLDEQSVRCVAIAREMRTPAIFYGIIGTLFIHYFIQLVFFKIIIDFIALGGKKTTEK